MTANTASVILISFGTLLLAIARIWIEFAPKRYKLVPSDDAYKPEMRQRISMRWCFATWACDLNHARSIIESYGDKATLELPDGTVEKWTPDTSPGIVKGTWKLVRGAYW